MLDLWHLWAACPVAASFPPPPLLPRDSQVYNEDPTTGKAFNTMYLYAPVANPTPLPTTLDYTCKPASFSSVTAAAVFQFLVTLAFLGFSIFMWHKTK